MVYDPQKNHRRPAPPEDGPAPVDSLISDEPVIPTSIADDPSSGPAVTPPPADPPPDALVFNSGVAAAVAAAMAALLARYLWRRRHSGGE